eukprot:Platyproteum_vivax@DN4518_c0_g1_i1.p1
MLQLYKNEVVTSISKQQAEIRQMELDWYTSNYWTMSTQATLIGGFAFHQLAQPENEESPIVLDAMFLSFTAIAMGCSLCVVTNCTYMVLWGPGLALKGDKGALSIHNAIDELKKEQLTVFLFFLTSLLTFYISNILFLFTLYTEWLAIVAALILTIFFIAMLVYTYSIMKKLWIEDQDAVEGRIGALQPYENIQDLDEQVTQTI